MTRYNLYCNSNSIIIGGPLSDDETGYQEIEYRPDLIRECLDGGYTGCNFHIPGDAGILLDTIVGQFKYIEAAGGLVVNNDNQSLVILRNGLFDLPKGKVEPGESIETAAVREVEEETGVKGPKINKKICDTYHFYRYGNDPTIIFKKTYWYLMDLEGRQETNPQTEEGISACFWATDSEIQGMMDKTHRNLKILFKYKMNGLK